MKSGDLIWLRDDEGNLTLSIYLSEAQSSIVGPRITVFQGGVIFSIGKHRTKAFDEAR